MSLFTFLHDHPPATNRGLEWFALSETATIQARSISSDSGGGGTATWTPSGTIICRIDPLGGGGSRLTGGQIDERSTHVCTAPADTTIDLANRVVIDGRGTFEVTVVRERTGQLSNVFEVIKV